MFYFTSGCSALQHCGPDFHCQCQLSWKLEKTDFLLKGSVLGKSLVLGITSFLSQISLVCAMAAINQMIQKYSPEFAINAAANDPTHSPEQLTQIPMAVVGIVMKFFQIVLLKLHFKLV